MKSRTAVRVMFVVVAMGAFAQVAIAQKPASRAPTAADWVALGKLPDLTGVWEIAGGGGGGRGTGTGPSLTPEAAARRKEFLANAPEDSQTANCLPPGMPGIMGQPYPMEFLLTPGKVTIVIEAYMQVRHIYTDGRSLPEDPGDDFHGTSVGRWEVDTLVVETVGLSPLTQIERGVPHSGKMRIVEGFRLTDPETMNIQTTITDPGVLTAPYTTNRTLRRHRDWTIAEYICQENNRNFVDDKGKAGINLTNPSAPSPKK